MNKLLLLVGLIAVFASSVYGHGWKGYRAIAFAPHAYKYNYGQYLLRSAYGANYLTRPYLYNPYLSTYNPYSNPYYRPYTPYSPYTPAYSPYASPYVGAGAYNPYAYRPTVPLYHPVYTRPLPLVARPFGGFGGRPFFRREAELDEAEIDGAIDADEGKMNPVTVGLPAPLPSGQAPENVVPVPIQPIFDNEDLAVDVGVKIIKGETLAQHLAHLKAEADAQMKKMFINKQMQPQEQPQQPLPQVTPQPQAQPQPQQ